MCFVEVFKKNKRNKNFSFIFEESAPKLIFFERNGRIHFLLTQFISPVVEPLSACKLSIHSLYYS